MLHLSAGMTVYFIFITALLGLAMGSFLNCFAYRYASGESVLKGRSHCGLCGHTLSFPDLVPVFSWLFLRGKCRYCGEKIPVRYPLTELICAAVYVLVLLRFDVSLEALQYLLLMSLLFTAAVTDLYSGLIPDRLIVIGAVGALAFTLFPWPEDVFGALLRLVINGLSVSLPLLLLVLLYDKLTKKESMGGGDIKLMFLIGLYFDWTLNLLILILACVLGIAFALIRRPKENEKHGQKGAFSFGPALAVSAWLVMLFGETALNWYLGFFI